MDAVKEAMLGVELAGWEFKHPIPYTFMYVQWEANKVATSHYIQYHRHLCDINN